MTLKTENYQRVRNHFIRLFGGKCQKCGSIWTHTFEFHHNIPPKIRGSGRGRRERMWEWFDAYADNNLELLCHDCHVKLHSENNKT